VTGPTGSPTTFGGIGKLEFAPTNNPDDPNPTYVDITPYLRTEGTPLEITRGRQTELDTIQPSQLTAVLDNTDNRFTFGLTTGPYGANWQPAKKIRYSETIAGKTVVLFTGYIEYPDISDWKPIGYQEVQLTCTDRLTRLSRGRPFRSTLAEHILFNSTPGCVWYTPFDDAPNVSELVSGKTLTPVFSTGMTAGSSIQIRTGGIAHEDDIANSLTIASLAGPGPGVGYSRAQSVAVRPPIAVGQFVTVVFWIIPQRNTDFAADDPNVGNLIISETGPTGVGILNFKGNFTNQAWYVSYTGGSLTGTLQTTRSMQYGEPLLVGARYGYNPATLELWVGADRFIGALAGVAQTGAALATITLPDSTGGFRGSLSHGQVYIGTDADWSHDDFLAQYQMGLNAAEYQTTGQRIHMLLDYAGVPGDQRVIDPGVSFMQAAQLAGQDPASALANAVATERGRGFIDGQGRYVFHDRTRIYNV